MGNDPVNMIDPSGGDIFGFGEMSLFTKTLVGTVAGAITGAIVSTIRNASSDKDEDDFKPVLYGALIGGGLTISGSILSQGVNLSTTLPTVAGNIVSILHRPTSEPVNPATPSTPPNSIIRVYIKHGKTKADGGDNSWDAWDGHTLVQIDDNIFHFYPSGMKGDKNVESSDLKESWHSNGEVGVMNINDPTTDDYFLDRESNNYGFSVFELSVTPSQKVSLLQNINKSMSNPPDYRTLGTRCQSWVSRMLRKAEILPNNIRQYSWSTVPFSKILFSKLPSGSLIYKTFSTKAP